jgi:hypothetical protein
MQRIFKVHLSMDIMYTICNAAEKQRIANTITLLANDVIIDVIVDTKTSLVVDVLYIDIGHMPEIAGYIQDMKFIFNCIYNTILNSYLFLTINECKFEYHHSPHAPIGFAEQLEKYINIGFVKSVNVNSFTLFNNISPNAIPTPFKYIELGMDFIKVLEQFEFSLNNSAVSSMHLSLFYSQYTPSKSIGNPYPGGDPRYQPQPSGGNPYPGGGDPRHPNYSFPPDGWFGGNSLYPSFPPDGWVGGNSLFAGQQFGGGDPMWQNQQFGRDPRRYHAHIRPGGTSSQASAPPNTKEAEDSNGQCSAHNPRESSQSQCFIHNPTPHEANLSQPHEDGSTPNQDIPEHYRPTFKFPSKYLDCVEKPSESPTDNIHPDDSDWVESTIGTSSKSGNDENHGDSDRDKINPRFGESSKCGSIQPN